MSIKIFLLFLLINFILIEGQYIIRVHGFEFEFEFNKSKAASQMAAKLPMKLKMVNHYPTYLSYYFSKDTFPTNEKTLYIKPGGIYLSKNNALILAYSESIITYKYTELGQIKNPDGIEPAVLYNGADYIEVEWFDKNNPNGRSEQKDEEGEGEEEEFDDFIKNNFQKIFRLNYFILVLLALIL